MTIPTISRPSLKQLFLTFTRLGLTGFGGPSMIAYIRHVSVEQKHWLDSGAFNDSVALCQMVPGATAMQVTASVGLKIRGVLGAAVCFIGFGLPAFLLMMTFSALFTLTHNLPPVVSAFKGLQAIIVAIVANATLEFGRITLKTWKHVLIAGFAAALFGLNVNPLLVIFLAAIDGLVLVGSKQPAPQKAASAIDYSFLRPLFAIFFVSLVGSTLLFIFDRDLANLAILLIRIDLTAFGGGFASVPLMFHEIVEVHHWMDGPTFLNGIILGQVTPGPIVITSTFIGYLLYGPLGGIIATISVFLPSFLIVLTISPFFERLQGSTVFNQAIVGVLCSFVGLLFTVIFRFSANVSWDLQFLLLAAGALITLRLKVDVFWVVLIGVIISVLLFI